MKNTKQNINQEISKRIKMLRKEKGLTQVELANEIGLGTQTIIGYENCKREPNSKGMAALERFFKVSGSYLRGETDERMDEKMNNEAIQMEVAERNENKKISKRIKQLRKEKGMTQVELAEDLGMPCKTLINWEVGERKPKYENMLLLAKYFNVSCAYIRCETDERQYDSENALTSKKTLDNEELDLLYNLVFKEIMWAERLAENFDLNSKENVDTKASLVKLAAKLMCMKN